MAVDRKADFKIKRHKLAELRRGFDGGDVYDPDRVTLYWRGYFNVLQRGTDLKIFVPECEYRRDELEWLANSPDPGKPIFVPDQIKIIPEDLPALAQLFPVAFSVQSPEVLKEYYSKEVQSGWMDIESSWRIPNTGLTERELREFAQKQNLSGLGLVPYIVGSYDKAEGHFFDEGDPKDQSLGDMYCRLIDTFHKEKVGFDRTATISFSPEGIIDVTTGLGPDQRRGDLGARFAGTPESLRKFRRIA